MCKFCDETDASVGTIGFKRAAIGLLMALSLLHESLTPRHLFRLSPDQLREAWLNHQFKLAAWSSLGEDARSSTCMFVHSI